jgi:hypothetical protein
MTTIPQYKHEFPDFDYDVAALIAELPAGWSDRSWHNDAMPKASADPGGYVELWFDYADAALSEFPEGRECETMKRFCLTSHMNDGQPIFETDDWPTMREWIKANADLIKQHVFEAEANDIAHGFTRLLKQQLTIAQWKEMVAKNKTDPRYASGACASQDYLDANMSMAEAFKDVTGREPDGDNEDDAALWNKAWELARKRWNDEASERAKR